MTRVTLSNARDNLAELVNQVLYREERVELTRRGSTVAFLISAAELEHLDRLEDLIDNRLMDEALAEGDKPIRWDKIRSDPGP